MGNWFAATWSRPQPPMLFSLLAFNLIHSFPSPPTPHCAANHRAPFHPNRANHNWPANHIIKPASNSHFKLWFVGKCNTCKVQFAHFRQNSKLKFATYSGWKPAHKFGRRECNQISFRFSIMLWINPETIFCTFFILSICKRSLIWGNIKVKCQAKFLSHFYQGKL